MLTSLCPKIANAASAPVCTNKQSSLPTDFNKHLADFERKQFNLELFGDLSTIDPAYAPGRTQMELDGYVFNVQRLNTNK